MSSLYYDPVINLSVLLSTTGFIEGLVASTDRMEWTKNREHVSDRQRETDRVPDRALDTRQVQIGLVTQARQKNKNSPF